MTPRRKKFLAFAAVSAVLLLAVGVLWRTPLLALWQPAGDANVLILSGNIEAHEKTTKSQELVREIQLFEN